MTSSDCSPNRSRFTMTVSPEAAECLDLLAKTYGDWGMAIRHAIGTQQFLLAEKVNGSRFYVDRTDGTRKEMTL
jgi:hypothetical protein